MSKIIPILNRFKYTFDNLINSSNKGSDTEAPAEARWIYILNNHIPGSREKEKGLEGERQLLKTGQKGISNVMTLHPHSSMLNAEMERR